LAWCDDDDDGDEDDGVRKVSVCWFWQVFSEGRLRAQDLMQYELQSLRL